VLDFFPSRSLKILALLHYPTGMRRSENNNINLREKTTAILSQTPTVCLILLLVSSFTQPFWCLCMSQLARNVYFKSLIPHLNAACIFLISIIITLIDINLFSPTDTGCFRWR